MQILIAKYKKQNLQKASGFQATHWEIEEMKKQNLKNTSGFFNMFGLGMMARAFAFLTANFMPKIPLQISCHSKFFFGMKFAHSANIVPKSIIRVWHKICTDCNFHAKVDFFVFGTIFAKKPLQILCQSFTKSSGKKVFFLGTFWPHLRLRLQRGRKGKEKERESKRNRESSELSPATSV